MNALASIAVFGTGVAAYQAASANKGIIEVNEAGQGGYVAYGVEVLKDTLRNTAIGVAAAVVAHFVIEAAPVLWAMLPAVPASVVTFAATIWTAIASVAAEVAAFILGMSLPQVGIVLAVVAAASLIIGGTYFIYKKTRPVVDEEVVVVPLVKNANQEVDVDIEPEIFEINEKSKLDISNSSKKNTPSNTPKKTTELSLKKSSSTNSSATNTPSKKSETASDKLILEKKTEKKITDSSEEEENHPI